MFTPWRPEVAVPPALATRLVAAVSPEIAREPAVLLGVGWDNAAYRFGGWVFRFPRREVGARLMRSEIDVLPRIAASLPLPIPVPEHVGRPTGGYPFPYAGYRMLPGRPACARPLSEADRARLAGPLGTFFAALHGLPVPEGLAGDPYDRADPGGNVARIRQWLPRAVGVDRDRAASLAERLGATPPYAGPPRVGHGDAHPCHVLVDDVVRATGIIDWGDVFAGDPALDLSIAFTLLPSRARSAFLDAYGPVDDATWARARLHALRYAVVLDAYAREAGGPDVARAAAWAWRGASEGGRQ